MTTIRKYAALIPASSDQITSYSWRPCPPGLTSPDVEDLLSAAIHGVIREATTRPKPDLAMVEAVARRHLGGGI